MSTTVSFSLGRPLWMIWFIKETIILWWFFWKEKKDLIAIILFCKIWWWGKKKLNWGPEILIYKKKFTRMVFVDYGLWEILKLGWSQKTLLEKKNLQLSIFSDRVWENPIVPIFLGLSIKKVFTLLKILSV